MNESTTSSAEMSISTPRRARSRRCASVRSSCSVIARRSCMSTWMVTRRQLPILRIGMRSMTRRQRRRWPCCTVEPARVERDRRSASGERRLGDDVREVDAEVDDRLRDLRPDAADDALGAHQARRRDGLQEMLRHQRVDGRHAGDVDDRDAGAGVDDLLEQALHHDLRPRAVERADQRQREDAVPELDDRRRELQHLLLLARDQLLAALSGRRSVV